MTVRVKFVASGATRVADDAYIVRLHPVYSDDPKSANAKFFKATPAGYIEMQLVDGSSAGMFPVGQEFFVDFTPVNKKG